MKYDEIKNSIIAAMSNPDTMETEMTVILEQLKTDYEALNSMTDELSRAQTRIMDLQDTNHKLFLAQTSPASEEPDEVEPPTGAGVLDEFKNLVDTLDQQQ